MRNEADRLLKRSNALWGFGFSGNIFLILFACARAMKLPMIGDLSLGAFFWTTVSIILLVQALYWYSKWLLCRAEKLLK